MGQNFLCHIFLVNLALVAVSMGLVSCVKTFEGGTPAPASSTEWKEGYGGDSIAMAAAQMIDATCFQARPLRKAFLNRALETDKDVAKEICGLLKSDGLIIESIDQPKVDGVDKDAANFPNAKPRRLQLKKAYWKDPATTDEAREKLLVHEIFPLIGLPDKDLVRSKRFRVALEVHRGHLGDLTCDKDALNSILAGLTPELAATAGRRLGQARCRTIVEMFAESSDYRTLEEPIVTDFPQSFGYGLFVAHARTLEMREMKDIENLLREASVAMPTIFHSWSPTLCAALIPHKSSGEVCGSILELMAGASPRQKLDIVGPAGHELDFNRSSVNFLMTALTSDEGYPNLELLPHGKIPNELIYASLRAQNWVQLLIFGQIQRHLTPEKRSSDVLLRNIRWDLVTTDANRMIFENEDLLNTGEFMLCEPYFILYKAFRAIDGELGGELGGDNVCRKAVAI